MSAAGLRRWTWALAPLAGSVLLGACASAPPPGAKPFQVTVTAAPVVASATAASGQDSSILQSARQWVFRVRNSNCLSVGTAFATSGELVTNRHVAAGASKLDLATWDGQDFSSQVAEHSGDEDLALLDGVPPNESYATLASSDPAPGTPVWVAGYPLGDQLTVTDGKILGVAPGSRYDLGAPVLQINNPIQHGNSGSPLLDSAGEVVGVVFAIDRQNHDGLAMPVSTLRALLDNGSGISSYVPCADLSG